MMSEGAQEQNPAGILLREQGRGMLQQMVRIRRFEEKCVELYSAMKIRGFLHLYVGEEAVAVGAVGALDARDAIVSTYREHGHAIVRGVPMGAIFAEMYGKQEGCAHGRGGSMHFFDATARLYGGNAIVGGGLPLAVGLALADKMQRKEGVTCCIFGDGAVAEGEFHESMNLASLWKLPVLFLCENNQYAMGTSIRFEHAVTDLARRADGYNVAAAPVDGMDVLAVRLATAKALDHIRSGAGPYFLECRTYRFRAHSMFDAELYRAKTEVEDWKRRDPIEAQSALLAAAGIAEATDFEAIEREADAEVNRAVEFAERGTWEPVENLARFVYSEPTRSV